MSSDQKEVAMKKSNINLKYRLSNEAIKDAFNFTIDSLLVDKSFDIEEYDLDVKLSKTAEADIALEGKRLTIKFPLDIEAKKKTLLKALKFDGSIHVTVVSNIDIDNDWEFTTETKLVDYQWLEKPVVKLGVLSLPIENILNLIINKANEKFISQLDETIKIKFSLKSQIESGLGLIKEPITLDGIDQLGLNVILEDFAMTHIKNKNEWTEGMIAVSGFGEIGEVKNLNIEPKHLPVFSWLDDDYNQKTSNLVFNIDTSIDVINKVARELLIGKKFSEGSKETTITEIVVRSNNGKVEIDADIIGTFKGQVFISLIPEYNEEERRFQAKNIQVKLQTKNILHRGLAWMLKGKIETELHRILKYSVDDLMKVIRGQLGKKIREYNQSGKTELAVSVKDLNVEYFELTNENVQGIIKVTMMLKISLLNFIGASVAKTV